MKYITSKGNKIKLTKKFIYAINLMLKYNDSYTLATNVCVNELHVTLKEARFLVDCIRNGQVY